MQTVSGTASMLIKLGLEEWDREVGQASKEEGERT